MLPRCHRYSLLLLAALAILGEASRATAEVAAAANEGWTLRTWQTDEGLPDNSVTGVTQTADGFLWIATLAGLVRFDGVSFEQFAPTHIPGVVNRNIRKMYLASRGAIWLAMDRGSLIRIDGDAARVFAAKDGLPDTRVTSMAEDADGSLWLSTGNEIYFIQDDQVLRLDVSKGFPDGGNTWLTRDEQGQLWLVAGSHLGVWRAGRWQTVLILESEGARLAPAHGGGLWICTDTEVLKFRENQSPARMARLPEHATVRALLEDRSGALWIGTAANGLLRLGADGLNRISVSQPEILALTEDREGNIWVGTLGGGVNQLRPRIMNLFGREAGLPMESVRSVCEDNAGWIWVTLQNGSLARGRDAHWNSVTSADGWTGGLANCVTPCRDGGVWIGTADRGLQRLVGSKTSEWNLREGLHSYYVRSVLQAKNGDLWLATDSPNRVWCFHAGQFREVPYPEELRTIRALAEGADGTIFAGTSSGILLRLDKEGAVSEIGEQQRDAYSVRCLQTTAADGSLWIGYAGSGVGRWHGGSYAHIGTAQGLFDDYVSQMLPDMQGRLWLIGNHGLFEVNLADLARMADDKSERIRSVAYGHSVGLPSLQPVCDSTPSAWHGTDGKFWFATRNGLLCFQPDKIRENTLPPPVILDEIKVDDQAVGLYDKNSPLRASGKNPQLDLRRSGASLELPPGYRKLEFDYAAPSFCSPENVHFRYRLKGYDNAWVEAGAQRSVNYPRLPAGNYEFAVTACNDAGVWNQSGYSLAIVVQPFYWQTWWFKSATWTAGAMMVGLTVFIVSRQRARRKLAAVERQRAIEEERARIARDIHDDLGSNLTRIVMLSESARGSLGQDNQAAPDLDEICETGRKLTLQLSEIVWAVNPEDDTLESFVTFVGKYANDFLAAAGVRCRLDLPVSLPAVALNSSVRHNVFLAFKEALSNAVKHANANSVVVSLQLAEKNFTLTVQDDGRGMSEPLPSKGHGLSNMRRRLTDLGGACKIESGLGSGTCVKLMVPLIHPVKMILS